MIRSGIYTLGIIVLTGILVPAYAQPGTDTTWKRGGNIGINLSQVSLSQWAAGGDNAVGFNLQFNYFANYKKGRNPRYRSPNLRAFDRQALPSG